MRNNYHSTVASDYRKFEFDVEIANWLESYFIQQRSEISDSLSYRLKQFKNRAAHQILSGIDDSWFEFGKEDDIYIDSDRLVKHLIPALYARVTGLKKLAKELHSKKDPYWNKCDYDHGIAKWLDDYFTGEKGKIPENRWTKLKRVKHRIAYIILSRDSKSIEDFDDMLHRQAQSFSRMLRSLENFDSHSIIREKVKQLEKKNETLNSELQTATALLDKYKQTVKGQELNGASEILISLFSNTPGTFSNNTVSQETITLDVSSPEMKDFEAAVQRRIDAKLSGSREDFIFQMFNYLREYAPDHYLLKPAEPKITVTDKNGFQPGKDRITNVLPYKTVNLPGENHFYVTTAHGTVGNPPTV